MIVNASSLMKDLMQGGLRNGVIRAGILEAEAKKLLLSTPEKIQATKVDDEASNLADHVRSLFDMLRNYVKETASGNHRKTGSFRRKLNGADVMVMSSLSAEMRLSDADNGGSPISIQSTPKKPEVFAKLTKGVIDSRGSPALPPSGTPSFIPTPAAVLIGPRTTKRKDLALEARDGGAKPFSHAAAATAPRKRLRVKSTPAPKTGQAGASGESATPRSGEKTAPPMAKAKAASTAAARASGEKLHRATCCGPTEGLVPRYEVCAKDYVSNKRVFVMSITVKASPIAGFVAQSVTNRINDTQCTKATALQYRDSLLN
ncbi:unnamed protein product, partial [Prorocentrum cordatum]